MFDIKLDKGVLLPALMAVSGAVDKKQSLAVLSNILFDFNPERMQLSATDLEIELSAWIDGLHTHDTFRTTVPAKKIIDIVRSLEDDASLTLKFSQDTLVIQSDRSRFKLSTLPADDFPTYELDKHDIEFSVSRETLIHLLQSTQFAMSQQDVRAYLNGLLMEMDGKQLTTVATDGHRMAICRWQPDFSASSVRILLPRKGVHELLRLLASIEDDTVAVAIGKGHFSLLTAHFNFSTRLLEARFPPYHKAIPSQHDKFVLVDRDTLKRSLNRISILAHEKSRAIVLQLHNKTLTLIANNQEMDEASELVEAHVDGDDLKIGMNASYLLDVLNILPSGLVRLSMTTADASIVVEPSDESPFLYIIMPMKI